MINTKKQIVVLTSIVLVLGLGVGALADRMVQRRIVSYRHRGRFSSGVLTERFTKELHLDSEQQKSVTRILEEKKAKLAQVRSEMMSKFAELKTSSQEEIRAILNPEQQAKFDEICQESDKRMEEWKRHGAHEEKKL